MLMFVIVVIVVIVMVVMLVTAAFIVIIMVVMVMLMFVIIVMLIFKKLNCGFKCILTLNGLKKSLAVKLRNRCGYDNGGGVLLFYKLNGRF